MENIHHLVISGGVSYGLTFYGSMNHFIRENIIDLSNIQTIYCTSAGALISTVIALKHDLTVLDNYLINRPWHDVFKLSLERVMNCYQNRGLFGKEFVFEVLESLFRANDLDINNITLKEFYEYNHISIHIFVVKLPDFELVDLNHISHPDWKLIDAVYASSCIPPFFQPLVVHNGTKNEWYVDGGFLMTYPLNPCIKDTAEGEEGGNILGIQLKEYSGPSKLSDCNAKINLFEYLAILIGIIINRIRILMFSQEVVNTNQTLYELNIKQSLGHSMDMFSIINSSNDRKRFIEYGKTCAAQFIAEYS
jgi:predicted acylesterase/phospholipase RssA